MTELAERLREFYASARKRDGTEYGKAAMSAIRAAIHRHITGAPHHRKINIMQDREFQVANHVYKGIIKTMKREGKDQTIHKQPISTGDLRKLNTSPVFATTNPVSLQRKVWFDIMLHFGRRGREGLRSLTKSSKVEADDTGRKFVRYGFNEKVKNHNGDLGDDYECKARMYATGTDNCPVSSFEKYVSKLNPRQDAFFQRPRSPFTESSECWYVNAPVGENTLGVMMRNISTEAELSCVYTNHCIRATTCKVLDDAGYDSRHIMYVSGHVNEASVKSYSNQPSTSQQRELSTTLSKSLLTVDPDTSCREIASVPHCPVTVSSSDYRCQNVHSLVPHMNSPSNSTPSGTGVVENMTFSNETRRNHLSSMFVNCTFEAAVHVEFKH